MPHSVIKRIKILLLRDFVGFERDEHSSSELRAGATTVVLWPQHLAFCRAEVMQQIKTICSQYCTI